MMAASHDEAFYPQSLEGIFPVTHFTGADQMNYWSAVSLVSSSNYIAVGQFIDSGHLRDKGIYSTHNAYFLST